MTSVTPDGVRRVAAARSDLLDHLSERRATVVEGISEKLLRSVPGYAAMHLVDRRRLEHAVGFAVGLVLAAWQEHRLPTDAERERLRLLGAERAAMGVSLHDVVTGIELGQQAGWTIAVQYAQRLVQRQPARLTADQAVDLMGGLARELSGVASVIRGVVTDSFLAMRRRLAGIRQEYYADLLLGLISNPDEGARRASEAQTDPDAPLGLLLVGSPEPLVVPDTSSLVDALPGALVVAPQGSAISHRVVVLPDPACQPWDRVLGAVDATKTRASVIPVGPVLGTPSVRTAYLDGLRALRLAIARQSPEGRLINNSTIALIGLLSEAPQRWREPLTAPLRAILRLTNGRELIETTTALLRHGATAAAARELNVHRNTVTDRRAQIEACTGLFFDDLDDRLALSAAIYLHRLGASAAI